jgi:hypothetical protein
MSQEKKGSQVNLVRSSLHAICSSRNEMLKKAMNNELLVNKSLIHSIVKNKHDV